VVDPCVMERIELSGVIGALSYALDIAEGQPPGHAVRSCLIGMRLAEELDLPPVDRSDLFYALLLKDAGCSANANRMAALFDADLVFEIQGHDGVLPWIGHKTGRQAIADFVRDIRTLTEPVTFDVEDILASDSRAAIIGALQTRIKATGNIIATQFAIILTITGDVVTRFQMLEDSFDVSKVARA